MPLILIFNHFYVYLLVLQSKLYFLHESSFVNTNSCPVLWCLCGYVGAEQSGLCWAVKRVAACVWSRRSSSLFCTVSLSPPGPPGLYRCTPLSSLSNNTISGYFQLSLMAECRGAAFRTAGRDCLCLNPEPSPQSSTWKNQSRLFTTWPESLCTCWVAFCSSWMIVAGNRMCTTLCYTSIMGQGMLILNWKF